MPQIFPFVYLSYQISSLLTFSFAPLFWQQQLELAPPPFSFIPLFWQPLQPLFLPFTF